MSEQLLSVKLKESTYRMVKTIAAWNGESIADCLSRIVDPVAKREMAKLSREVQDKDKRENKE